ncbi:hypothetical protein B0H14DRAFT_2559031 [Mycena olivaceomarginata]|nr:hypothetical protein B0H14DRAFT_2559031 [Mycena olivaceomarginata]
MEAPRSKLKRNQKTTQVPKKDRDYLSEIGKPVAKQMPDNNKKRNINETDEDDEEHAGDDEETDRDNEEAEVEDEDEDEVEESEDAEGEDEDAYKPLSLLLLIVLPVHVPWMIYHPSFSASLLYISWGTPPFVTDVTETSRNNILSIAKEAFTKVITMLREHLSSKTSLGGREILVVTF